MQACYCDPSLCGNNCPNKRALQVVPYWPLYPVTIPTTVTTGKTTVTVVQTRTETKPEALRPSEV